MSLRSQIAGTPAAAYWADFVNASAQYHVPVAVLLDIAYRESSLFRNIGRGAMGAIHQAGSTGNTSSPGAIRAQIQAAAYDITHGPEALYSSTGNWAGALTQYSGGLYNSGPFGYGSGAPTTNPPKAAITEPLSWIYKHALNISVFGLPVANFLPGPFSEAGGVGKPVGHMDIQVPENTAFYAPAGNWKVKVAAITGGWGEQLTLSGAGGALITFLHLDKIGVKTGQTIKGGQQLGLSGGVVGTAPGLTSQYSQGAHLHVAYNQAAANDILAAYGTAGFVANPEGWAYGLRPEKAGGGQQLPIIGGIGNALGAAGNGIGAAVAGLGSGLGSIGNALGVISKPFAALGSLIDNVTKHPWLIIIGFVAVVVLIHSAGRLATSGEAT